MDWFRSGFPPIVVHDTCTHSIDPRGNSEAQIRQYHRRKFPWLQAIESCIYILYRSSLALLHLRDLPSINKLIIYIHVYISPLYVKKIRQIKIFQVKLHNKNKSLLIILLLKV